MSVKWSIFSIELLTFEMAKKYRIWDVSFVSDITSHVFLNNF